MAPRQSRINLRVSSPFRRRRPERHAQMPWSVAAGAGALIVAVASWLVVAGLVVLGWVTAPSGSLLDALRLGTQGWLLLHGAGAQLGDVRVSLTPLGVSAILVLLLHGAASYAARQARLRADEADLDLAVGATARNVTLLTAGVYALAVTATSMALGTPTQTPQAFVGSAVIGLLGAGWGSFSALGYDPAARWPRWLRAVPRATGAAVALVLAGGAVVTVVALLGHWDRVRSLDQALGAGAVGGVLLALVEVAYAPVLLLWGSSYALGAGFTLGPDTLVSPANVKLGFLPGIPVFGALPDQGAPGAGPAWWLLVGVVAGVVAGYVVVRSRPRARADETALVGGLAGVLAGLVVTALALLARGDLGVERLSGIGPRIPELAIMAGSLLGLSGLGAGLLVGLFPLAKQRLLGRATNADRA